MSAFQNLRLLMQCVDTLEGLRRDLRANAQSYKDNSNGLTLAQLKAVILADGQEYQRHLQWIVDIPQSDRDAALTVASALGMDSQELINAYQFLKGLADLQVANAPGYASFSQISNGSDYILANVPAHYSLW